MNLCMYVNISAHSARTTCDTTWTLAPHSTNIASHLKTTHHRYLITSHRIASRHMNRWHIERRALRHSVGRLSNMIGPTRTARATHMTIDAVKHSQREWRYPQLYTGMCMCVCMYVCMYVYLYVHMHVCICMSVRVHACRHIRWSSIHEIHCARCTLD